MLHFGAVDYEAEVVVNGVLVGSHKGGYDSLSIDVTEVVGGSDGLEEVMVRVREQRLPDPLGRV